MSELENLLGACEGHSIFSPSSSSRWMNCAGSLVPNLKAKYTSVYEAVLGTVAHSVAERWLREGRRPLELIGEVEFIIDTNCLYQIEIDKGMLAHLEEYVHWCQQLPGEHFIERRVDFSRLTPLPDQFGTADHVAVMPGEIVVTDLKYGKGVKVYAKENSQLLIYALGAYFEFDSKYHFDRVTVRIGQPRLDHFDTWSLSREELLAFGEQVKEKAKAAWRINGPRVAGEEQCRFCRVKADCPALAQMAEETTAAMFAEEPLTLSQMAEILRQRKTIESWLKSLEATLRDRAMAGEEVPGYNLVNGRGSRSFRSEEEAAKRLREMGLSDVDIYSVKLCSPSQAEELLKLSGIKGKSLSEKLGPLIARKSGRPILAPIKDQKLDSGNLWLED